MIPDQSRESFLAWLRQFGDDDVVGRAGSDCGCPLATWYGAAGLSGPIVMGDMLYHGLHDNVWHGLPLEPWQIAFVIAVDDAYKDEVVSAKEALTLMESIE